MSVVLTSISPGGKLTTECETVPCPMSNQYLSSFWALYKLAYFMGAACCNFGGLDSLAPRLSAPLMAHHGGLSSGWRLKLWMVT